ncbi:probable E3 ubiquitin-protein ligase HERC4 [Myxocyprinus asiaticus]|uniref:probable E3 ubiquitin-protein ligase HERC4 n=1 Tax=Myxocyprinus asiaticus TaxID=70543 RepID=UPI00222251CE|nr:probable E3 ubiquitin-protein ligase HERC4 [Myxocyprinus asiaticus]
MLYSWGACDGEGFDVVSYERTKQDNSVVKTLCAESTIQDEPTGKYLGFIGGDGNVTVLSLYVDGNVNAVVQKRFSLKKDKIKVMKCGPARALLFLHEGKILLLERGNSCRPFRVLCDRQVTQVACGNQHSIALIRDGQLLVWGENSHGQLGLGKEERSTLSPQPLKSLCGIPLAQISAGGDHSFALSLSGVVFGWGKNNAGQLGLGDITNKYTPTCVKSLNQKKTVFISCGEEHTAILTKGGFVFTCGSGRFGQLGHNSLRDEYHPRLIAELMGSKVSQIACGQHHTLALSELFNVIYSFGCGEQGQLGNAKTINQTVPLPIHLPSDHNPALKVKRVVAGGNISFAFYHELNHERSVIPSVCATLDDQIIDKWLTECDTNAWTRAKREIKRMFSSASFVNGSFIDKSCDQHFLTSAEYSGLDLSLARLAFEKIATKTKVLSEVQQSVMRELLPSLSICPAGVEALRIYLILPELIRVIQKQKQQTELAVDLAGAILKLDPFPCDALESLWTRMPYSYFRTLVKTLRSESAKLIEQMTAQHCDNWESLTTILRVLKRLFLVNRQRKSVLIESQFCISEVAHLPMNGNLELLVPFSFVADTVTKQKIFNYLKGLLMQEEQTSAFLSGLPNPVNMLHINRESLLKDTLEYLRKGILSFSYPLMVAFIGENGIDIRGLSATFFSLLSEAFLSWEKKLLEVSENSQLVWFNPDTCDVTDFYYLGIMCGMALYNHHYMNINFPLALFKKLLQLSPTLSDLEELSPVEARGLKNLLEEEEEDVDGLLVDFTVKGQELFSNGCQVPVTKNNRQMYVDLYVDFVFNKSVKNQFEQFSIGFFEGCPLNAWRMFHPEELRELFHGSPTYEWKDLPQCSTYEHCSPSDELITNFWTVFFEFSEEQRKKFLFFMYGTDRVPAGGLSKLSLKIVQLNLPEPDDRFPEAQTCFGKLHLPKYSNIDILRNKLIHAINFCEVFGRV